MRRIGDAIVTKVEKNPTFRNNCCNLSRNIFEIALYVTRRNAPETCDATLLV